MSEYKILGYENSRSYATLELSDENPSIDSETIDLLFDYYKRLGVTTVKNVPKGNMWELKGYWYSQAQIERMLAIKVFA